MQDLPGRAAAVFAGLRPGEQLLHFAERGAVQRGQVPVPEPVAAGAVLDRRVHRVLPAAQLPREGADAAAVRDPDDRAGGHPRHGPDGLLQRHPAQVLRRGAVRHPTLPLRRHPPPARSHQEGDQTRGRRPGPQDHQARLQQTRQPRLRAEALPEHRHQKKALRFLPQGGRNAETH